MPRSRDIADSGNAGLYRDIALVALADGIVGLSFGAAAVAGGLPWWVPVALSVLVFAGGSQIAAVGVVLGGGSAVAAVAAGAVLNTRLLPYGLAVADVVGPAEGGSGGAFGSTVRSWLTRIVGAHLITDESVAFALRQAGPARRRFAFWTCGIVLFAVWNTTVLLGVLAGSMITNTDAFGLDATFPAVVVALALPALTSRPIRNAAGAGAVIAVALTPVLPAGLPLLAALGGLAARRDRWPERWRGPRAKAGQGNAEPGSIDPDYASPDSYGGTGSAGRPSGSGSGSDETICEVRAGRTGGL